jgi:Na+/H+-dicarboxylate symporter
MKLSKLQLYTKVLIGLVAGVLFGMLASQLGFSDFVSSYIKPIGSVFIKLISMVVIPLVFASLLVGTSSLNDIRKLGRIGAKTMAYFLCTTIIALCIGLLLANTFRPGVGLSEQAQTKLIQSSPEESIAPIDPAYEKPTIIEILLNIIPTNPIKAFVEGRML